jgi:carbon-monoxide dehydrogenase medium subunit
MYPTSFDYYRPTSVAEAIELLRQHEDARVLAGGHSLLPAMKLRATTPAVLVDIGRIPGLAGIRTTATGLRIGALTTHAAIAASDAVKATCPILAEAAAQIGDVQVRNRGTIGGSLAYADPAADLPTVMVALNATLIATGPNGEREIPAREFFVDLFTTALRPDELLTAIEVPALGAGSGSAYVKHRHPASSYAVVGVAAIVTLRDGRCADVSLAVGGATANPVIATAAQQALIGQAPSAEAIAAAAERVTEAITNPLSDTYASGEYRTHLATALARRALTAAVERAG